MSSFDPIRDIPDLTGRVAIVTGATSGIGFAISQQLLRKGATVYLAARSESKAIATISRLEAEGLGPGNGKPIWHKLDLDHPRDAKTSAEEFLTRETRLDILVNNAAMLITPYKMGPIGVQAIMTVNHFSPFVFTNILLPLLKQTAASPGSDVRIVNVSSKAYEFAPKAQFESKADLNGPVTGDGFPSQFKRYGFSKLANILWTRELARRLHLHDDQSTETGLAKGTKAGGIISLSVHPGGIATEGSDAFANQLPWPLSSLYIILARWFLKTPADGAKAVLFAIAAPQVREDAEKYDGAYLEPVGKIITPTTEAAQSEKLAEDLWALTEHILAEEGL